MLICGYTYVRPYATAYNGMQWHTTVCNQRIQWDATAYNGMQRHTNECDIFTT